ncbi:universal stress protein [Streptomyces sp. ODS28]|uniref:universal stress protein n=1 Tax=Streptomyces sp. ODS28 TaxID=3136688 RepID=UPI0031F095BE
MSRGASVLKAQSKSTFQKVVMMQPAQGAVVVGIDGSVPSAAALRWALGQARLLRTAVLAVHAWLPSTVLRAPYAPASEEMTEAEERARAQEVLRGAVGDALMGGPRVRVRTALERGAAAALAQGRSGARSVRLLP